MLRVNKPPEDAPRVDHHQLHDFVFAAARTVGLPEPRARLLADLLVTNDLRGVFSHGSHQIATYARLMRDGELNSEPQIKIARETANSLLLDGDGGLGYFPSYEGTQKIIDKARDQGMAILLTQNHGHFGAAGIYARLPLEHDMITFVTSGHQLDLQPDEPLIRAAGGSPMSFSAPADEEESLVLDFGAAHGLFRPEDRQKFTEMAPGLVLRGIGMGEVCQAWGGLLTGLSMDPATSPWTYSGADQGAMVITFRIDLFADPAAFKKEMDEYVRRVSRLQPLDGFDEAHMPGGIEALRTQQHRTEGVPLGEWHQKRLQQVATEFGLPAPWE
jgi:L-2-hydroxycarboxylate dehydrogenase (NAD+)